MSKITLVGMNHYAGIHGLMPKTIQTKSSELEYDLDSLFKMGYQNVIRIECGSQDPFVHTSTRHSRVLKIA